MASVMASSLKMAVATFSSRILGLIREQVMAAMFGASSITDAFTVAYRVPNMLRDLFAEGAFSSAFVPIFTEARKVDEQSARRLLWSLMVILGVMTTAISVLIIIFAEPIVLMFTDKQFAADPVQLKLTIQLTQLMSPFLVLVSLAALVMGALNSLKVFFIPALSPAMFNLSMIACMFGLPGLLESYGWHGVFAMGLGVIGGGLLQFLFQVPLLFKKGYGPIKGLDFYSGYIKRILTRVGISVVGIAASQINILITTILATSTQVGAVSWLTYAFRLFQFPVGILGVSIAGSNLVHFSDAWKEGDREGALSFLRSSVFISLATMIPALALLMALSDETVALVFQRGAFDAHDTDMSGLALRCYLVGLPCYGFYKIFAPTFFTLDKPRIPVLISLVSITFSTLFCLYFTPRYGFHILALGASLSMLLNNLLQVIFLHRFLQLKVSELWSFRHIKILVAGLLCFAVTYWLKPYQLDASASLLARVFQYLLVSGEGAATYFIALTLMGERELLMALRKRWKK